MPYTLLPEEEPSGTYTLLPEDKPKKPKASFLDVMGAIGMPAAAVEPVLAMASGLVAKPLSDVAGLAAIPAHASGLTATEPMQVKNAVQRGMSYEPQTDAGKIATEYNPIAILGKVIDLLGSAAEKGVKGNQGGTSILRDALASGAHEAVNQAPLLLGTKVPKALDAAGDVLQGDSIVGARRWMQSALKPDKATRASGKADAAVSTLLDEGVNATKGGAEVLQKRIDALHGEVKDIIANSDATVNVGAPAAKIAEVLDKYQRAAASQADLASVQRVWDDYLANPLLKGQLEIPVQLAQEMKQGIYKDVGDKSYGLGLKPAAERDARKALASGLREGIEQAEPGVVAPNAEIAKLMTALKPVEQRSLVAANNNIAGLGALAVHQPGAFMMWMADRSALFKSLVARMLNGAGIAVKGLGEAGTEGLWLGVAESAESARKPRALPAPQSQLMLPPPSITLRDLVQ